MNIDEYIKTRVDGQIEWFDRKSSRYKRHHVLLTAATIILSISVPFIISLDVTCGEIVSVVSAIIVSACTTFKFSEKWQIYRITSELLIREKFLFQTHSGPYKDDHKDAKFIETIESILNATNESWQKLISADGKENKGDGGI